MNDVAIQTSESPITIDDAMCLMNVLRNDISYSEKNKIAFLLLVMAANPSLAENGNVVVSKQNKREYQTDYGYYSDYG